MCDLNFLDSHRSIRVGLLGGSFNPPHPGHLHISTEALKELDLNFIIWIVAYRNPLKEESMKFSFEKRFRDAQSYAQHNKIVISRIEKQIDNTYTSVTINYLIKRFAHIKFCWIMGVDNLLHFHTWKNWHNIINQIFIAVFNRGNFGSLSIESEMALIYKDRVASESQVRLLKPGYWRFFECAKSDYSSSAIRSSRIY
ncbi:MAG: adenylyltransferase/cytidyltransferase family protein [Proteobacteria bacterium]|nr:adenylyltransferase/cytidyltransferase family protein [Pseudomonadota bacterium]